MPSTKPDSCFFCGSKKIRIPQIGISFSMCGDEYNFCAECLKSMTADEFWKRMFHLHNFRYPPQLAKDRGHG